MISNYYWRIRAQDSRYSWSPWTSNGYWFVHGVPPPDAATLTRNVNGTYTLTWEVGSENWYVQASPTLTGNWQTAAGPMGLNEWTFAPDPGHTSRY